ncbi:hypothetical protein P2318_30920 [Myxococcaceae bacterium GXIMD 01537]
MADRDWGNCKNCRYFASRSDNPGDDELANCIQRELRDYDLKVSGLSGCNAFELRTAAPASQEAPSAQH